MTDSQKIFLDRIQSAVSYAGSESDISIMEAVGVLEFVKMNLYHKQAHICPRCNQTQLCSHCDSQHPAG